MTLLLETDKNLGKKLCDLLERERVVDLLTDRESGRGSHLIKWSIDGLASGGYLVSASSPDGRASEKNIVLK